MFYSKKKFPPFDLKDFTIEKIIAGKFNQLLLVLPTNRMVRNTILRILNDSVSGALANLKIHTLSTLSVALFNELYQDKYFLLDDATAVIKLKKIFSDTELRYFNKNDDITSGTVLMVKNLISDFKRKGITIDILKEDINGLSGVNRDKAEDITKIYEIYQQECLSKKLFEIGDIYQFLTKSSVENLKESFKRLFPDVDTFILNEFDELTTLEIKLIDLISDLVDNSLIHFDYDDGNPDLFSHLRKTLEKIQRVGFKKYVNNSISGKNSFIKQIKQSLFTVNPEKKESDVEIFIYSAENREDEVSFIAQTIKKYLTESLYQPESICVAFNQISNYSRVIDEVFDDYGIPYNLTDRFLLSNSSTVVSIINFLEILENDFYYKNIFRALSGNWIQLESVDKVNLQRVSSTLKIISGLNNWLNKLANAIDECDSNPDSESNILTKEIYMKAIDDIKTIHSFLSPFEKLLSPREFLNELNNLIKKLDIISKSVNENEPYIEKNTRALTKFIDLLNNLVDVIEIEYGSKAHSLSFYLDNIKSAAQFTRYNVTEKPGVLVTSIDEIRGLSFDLLIIGGMVDGEFPTRYSPEILVPDKYKSLEEGHLQKERYKFYEALKVINSSVFFTYPSSHESVNLTVSTFLSDLISLFSNNVYYINREKIICSSYELKKKADIFLLSNISSIELSKHNIDLKNITSKCEIDNLRRTEPFSESYFNGFLNLDDILNINKEYFQKNTLNDFSASKLEEYVKCPFKFFLNRILKLKVQKEPTEEVEAIEIGTIVHSILYEFYKELVEKNLTIENCDDNQFDFYVDLIFSIAESKIKKEYFDNSYSFFELEKILGINGNKKFSILYRFLEEERKPKNGFKPFYFEKKFGNKPGFDKVTIEGVHLQGSIDRVDVNFNENLFSVIDYKLRGSKASKEDIREGISLQLPLYLYATKCLLEAEFNSSYEPFSAEIFSLKLFGDEFGRKPFHHSSSTKSYSENPVEINHDMISIFSKTISNSIQKIKKGEFHLSTLKNREDKVCKYCEFGSVCRVNEIINK
jgi:ATP-dependent helicase/nuclease subunit B